MIKHKIHAVLNMEFDAGRDPTLIEVIVSIDGNIVFVWPFTGQYDWYDPTFGDDVIAMGVQAFSERLRAVLQP